MGDSISRHTEGLPFRSLLKTSYRRLLDWQYGDRGIVCTLPDGERVRVSPRHRHLSWNMDEYAAFKRAVPRGGIVLDVGANLGCYSLLFAQWAGPEGRVFAFEPAPDAAAALRTQVKLNQLESIVDVVQTAVGKTSGNARFRASGIQGDNRMMVEAEAEANCEAITTPMTSIDAFCQRQNIRPDLIKIDVEGFELDVLAGAEETIRETGDRLSLFVEMHPSTWPKIGLSKSDVLATLRRAGLKAQSLTSCDDPWSVEGCCMRLVRDAEMSTCRMRK